MKKKKKNEKLNKAVGITFAVAVAGVAVGTWLVPDKAYSAEEKRNLSAFPTLSLSSITDGSFMNALEDYEADQFPLRSSIMSVKTSMDEALGEMVSQGIVRLDKNHLAEVFNEPDDEDIHTLITSVNNFSSRQTDKNIYFMLAPNAISVNGENLPDYTPTDDQNDYIDKIYSGLDSSITTVDVRETFANYKDMTELYYGTDHHWTTDGAFLAYQLTVKAMGLEPDIDYTRGVVCNSFSGTLTGSSGFSVGQLDDIIIYVPNVKKSYTVNYDGEAKLTATCYDTDALKGDNPYEVFFGGNHASITINTTAGTGRKLMIFKDSYANCFVPFLMSNYDTITMIDSRYYYDDIDMTLAGGYTDILFLYNVNTLSEDNSLCTVLDNEQ